MTQVSFGWLIRSIHSWSANLMIGAAMIHMFSTFLLKSYRQPREVTWLTGMALLGLALAFGFSGYLLPWNQLAFFATKVGTDIVGDLPVIGRRTSRRRSTSRSRPSPTRTTPSARSPPHSSSG